MNSGPELDTLYAQLDWNPGIPWLGWMFGSPEEIERLREEVSAHIGGEIQVLDLSDWKATISTVLEPCPEEYKMRWIVCAPDRPDQFEGWTSIHLRLNERRHRLMQSNPGGVIFAAPQGNMAFTRKIAPDLWTVRVAVIGAAREADTNL